MNSALRSRIIFFAAAASATAPILQHIKPSFFVLTNIGIRFVAIFAADFCVMNSL
jgi:hypothetical protein